MASSIYENWDNSCLWRKLELLKENENLRRRISHQEWLKDEDILQLAALVGLRQNIRFVTLDKERVPGADQYSHPLTSKLADVVYSQAGINAKKPYQVPFVINCGAGAGGIHYIAAVVTVDPKSLKLSVELADGMSVPQQKLAQINKYLRDEWATEQARHIQEGGKLDNYSIEDGAAILTKGGQQHGGYACGPKAIQHIALTMGDKAVQEGNIYRGKRAKSKDIIIENISLQTAQENFARFTKIDDDEVSLTACAQSLLLGPGGRDEADSLGYPPQRETVPAYSLKQKKSPLHQPVIKPEKDSVTGLEEMTEQAEKGYLQKITEQLENLEKIEKAAKEDPLLLTENNAKEVQFEKEQLQTRKGKLEQKPEEDTTRYTFVDTDHNRHFIDYSADQVEKMKASEELAYKLHQQELRKLKR